MWILASHFVYHLGGNEFVQGQETIKRVKGRKEAKEFSGKIKGNGL